AHVQQSTVDGTSNGDGAAPGWRQRNSPETLPMGHQHESLVTTRLSVTRTLSSAPWPAPRHRSAPAAASSAKTRAAWCQKWPPPTSTAAPGRAGGVMEPTPCQGAGRRLRTAMARARSRAALRLRHARNEATHRRQAQYLQERWRAEAWRW